MKKLILFLLLFCTGLTYAQPTIFFDDMEAGESAFTIGDSSFSGGEVVDLEDCALTATPDKAYVMGEFAGIDFGKGADRVNFYFSHDGENAFKGMAEAYDLEGNSLGSFASYKTSFSGDPLGYVTFDYSKPIGSITFTGGAVDNFTVAHAPAPGAFLLGSIGVGFVGLLRRRFAN